MGLANTGMNEENSAGKKKGGKGICVFTSDVWKAKRSALTSLWKKKFDESKSQFPKRNF